MTNANANANEVREAAKLILDPNTEWFEVNKNCGPDDWTIGEVPKRVSGAAELLARHVLSAVREDDGIEVTEAWLFSSPDELAVAFESSSEERQRELLKPHADWQRRLDREVRQPRVSVDLEQKTLAF